MDAGQVDCTVENQGTLWLFRPATSKATEWIETFVDPDATWFCGALVVEHRFGADLVTGMREADLIVEHC